MTIQLSRLIDNCGLCQHGSYIYFLWMGTESDYMPLHILTVRNTRSEHCWRGGGDLLYVESCGSRILFTQLQICQFQLLLN